MRRISSSRPITGSSLPFSARSVRSTQYLSKAWRDSSTFGSVTAAPPRMLLIASISFSRVTPASFRTRPASLLSSTIANSINSLAIYWSPRCCANLSVRLKSRAIFCDKRISPSGSLTWGKRSSASPILRVNKGN